MSDIKASFQEQRYYVAKGLFAADEIRALDTDFDRIVRQLTDSGEAIDATWDGGEAQNIAAANDVILHTHNVQKYSRTWLTAFLNERFLNVVEQIIGPDIILHHSKLFQKPSENGAPFPMHQDWPYFPTVKDSMIAGIIHVSDATDRMGCLRVYPGSHRLGRIDGADGRRHNDVLDQCPIEGAKIIEAEAGDVVFFHYFTMHGSMPNRTDAPRQTVPCQLHAGTDHVEAGNAHPDERMILRGCNHHISRTSAGRAA